MNDDIPRTGWIRRKDFVAMAVARLARVSLGWSRDHRWVAIWPPAATRVCVYTDEALNEVQMTDETVKEIANTLARGTGPIPPLAVFPWGELDGLQMKWPEPKKKTTMRSEIGSSPRPHPAASGRD